MIPFRNVTENPSLNTTHNAISRRWNFKQLDSPRGGSDVHVKQFKTHRQRSSVLRHT